MFFANDHNNYAHYVPDYTHKFVWYTSQMQISSRKKYGICVSQPLVLSLRNAFYITIRQTIKRYYRLQQLELRIVLQMEWCITHHIRAQQNNSSMHLNEIFNLLRCKVERVLEAVSGFTNPCSSSFEDNELYFLSVGVPAKPGIANALIEADDIGRKAVADLNDSLLILYAPSVLVYYN